MPDRDIVNMQVRRSFVNVENGVENKEIRVALGKSLHIFGKTFGGSFCVGCAYPRIAPVAYLHNIFVKALTFICGGNHVIAGCMGECIAEIPVFDTAVCSFLFCIVTFNCFRKALIISLSY